MPPVFDVNILEFNCSNNLILRICQIDPILIQAHPVANCFITVGLLALPLHESADTIQKVTYVSKLDLIYVPLQRAVLKPKALVLQCQHMPQLFFRLQLWNQYLKIN